MTKWEKIVFLLLFSSPFIIIALFLHAAITYISFQKNIGEMMKLGITFICIFGISAIICLLIFVFYKTIKALAPKPQGKIKLFVNEGEIYIEIKDEHILHRRRKKTAQKPPPNIRWKEKHPSART